MRTLLVLICLSLAAGAAGAAELRGQDDPRFRSALALWLADDEATALPELATLAAGGNRAAQVLLAQIDVLPSLQGPLVAGLPRAERNALLRAPGGLSGRSWMRIAAEDTEFARLWLEASSTDATGETALALAAMGERRAARKTLDALSLREYRGFAAMADHPDYPSEMRYLIWREWADDPAGRVRAEAESAALDPGDPQRALLNFRPVDPVAFDEWLASAALAAPTRVACEAACPGSVRSCTRAAYQLASSYASGAEVFDSGHGSLLLTLGSPVEILVASEDWNASPRGRASVLRTSQARSPDAAAMLARVAVTDACFAAAVTADAARFPR
jgi:hypothetical protein